MSNNDLFGKLPNTITKNAVSQFTIHFPDSDLERMRTLIKLSNVATPCYENSLPPGDRKLGLPHEWLVEAKVKWENDFDWRTHESRINSFPNFQAAVPFDKSDSSSTRTLKVHFTALFSQSPTATTVVLLHGWPGSFLEFLPMLSILCSKYTPETLPYNIIVPSLPGYTLSEAFPLDRNCGMDDAARILDTLIVDVLGLASKGYIVQGGDVGSRIGRIMCAQYPRCTGALLNLCMMPPPESGPPVSALTAAEQKGLERLDWFKAQSSAYAVFQATKPATLGFVLTSNPLAVLAWIGEKFLDWVDPASFADASSNDSSKSDELLTKILESVTLYYLTSHVHTCWYSYREAFAASGSPPKTHASPQYHIHAPKRFGFSYFPMEISLLPKSWIATTGNLVFWREHKAGGHFAAMEQPEFLLQDLEDFVEDSKQE